MIEGQQRWPRHSACVAGRCARCRASASLSRAGEALGIVGESGCGKTTTARLLLRLEEPSGGRVRFLGDDITAPPRRGAAARSARRAQLVFQNPFDALNPRFTIRRALAEPLHNFGVPRTEHAARIEAVMQRVRLLPAAAWLDRRPHELSGGQLQRVVLARALLPQPRLIVADEPVSMLDVSVRAGILNLLRERARRARSGGDLHQPRPGADPLRLRAHAGDVSRPGRGGGADRGADRRARCIPIPARWSPRCRCRASIRIAPRCRSAAVWLKRRRRPKAARSALAVRMPSHAARSKSPALREVAPGRRVACHLAVSA